MILSEFTYREASGWHVEKLKLNHQNLIVGLNSVGKSRTISAIGHVASFIKGDVDAQGSGGQELSYTHYTPIYTIYSLRNRYLNVA